MGGGNGGQGMEGGVMGVKEWSIVGAEGQVLPSQASECDPARSGMELREAHPEGSSQLLLIPLGEAWGACTPMDWCVG